MQKQLAIICALSMATLAVGIPLQVTGSNIARASVSNTDFNPVQNPVSGGYVERKFKSTKEEDARTVQNYIEGMLRQMTSHSLNKALPQQVADEDMDDINEVDESDPESDPEEAELWGRYGGRYGGYGRGRRRFRGRGRYGRYRGYGGYSGYGGYGGYGGCYDWDC